MESDSRSCSDPKQIYYNMELDNQPGLTSHNFVSDEDFYLYSQGRDRAIKEYLNGDRENERIEKKSNILTATGANM